MKKVNGCTKLMGLVSLGQEHDDLNSLCLKGIAFDICKFRQYQRKRNRENLHHLASPPSLTPQPPPKITKRVQQIPRLDATFFVVKMNYLSHSYRY